MNLPEQICDNCFSDLETAFKFRTNCESSDAILNSFVVTVADNKPSNEVVFSTDSGDVYKFRAPPNLKVKRIKKEILQTPVVQESNTEPDPEFEFVDQSVEYIDVGGDESIVDEDDNTVYYVEQLREDELEFYEEELEKESSEADDPIESNQDQSSANDILPVPIINVKAFKNVNRPPNKFIPKPDIDNKLLSSAEIITKENGKKVYRVKRMFKEETKPLKVCKLCGNQYKYQHALDSHMRRHNNEKPFECE